MFAFLHGEETLKKLGAGAIASQSIVLRPELLMGKGN